MLKKYLSFAFLALAAFVTSHVHAEEGLTLAYHFEPGETRTMSVHLEQEMTCTLHQCTPMITHSSNTSTYQLNVESVDPDGTAHIKMTFAAFTIQGESGDMNYAYDSSNTTSEDSIFQSIFTPLIGTSFNIVVTKQGELKEVSGLGILLDAIYAMFETTDDKQAGNYREILKKLLNEEALQESLVQSLIVYRENPVHVGDAWDIQTNKVLPKGTLDNHYCLSKLENGVAHIDHTFMLTCEPLVINMDTMECVTTTNASGKGFITLDVDSGWVKKQVLIQMIEGEQSLSPCKELPDGLTWPFVGKTIITTTIN